MATPVRLTANLHPSFLSRRDTRHRPSLNRRRQALWKSRSAAFPKYAARRVVGVRAAGTDTASGESSASANSGKSLTYTAYEGNSWGVQFTQTGVRLLTDPWLVGDLTFADIDWLYKGVKRTKPQGSVSDVTLGVDFLLISQGLDDHAHRPTLKQLDKALPVVCSPTAAEVCRELGFKTVISLKAGQSCEMCDGKISITASAGALVGPPWSTREAGFVVKENVPNGVSLYYEPHCDHDFFDIRKIGTVDVVVSPAVSVDVGSFPLVKGYDGIVELARVLRPATIIPLLNADIEQEGVLAQVVTSRGTVQELPTLLRKNGMGSIQVVIPEPLKPMVVNI
eukprot:CAMPEP_0177759372 /NCGR_PEP_ID=MMETSP0491_2-20121128/4699_1 /TAXON_ID=63592 /ORGANISM="Tetraselmis chuii, Strain PLY429" /LENGTH=337 /DNA_ID=CAMNT_0019275201 /DNA_START=280 /DNA_END=1293 /DNA_ORIENTATION=+